MGSMAAASVFGMLIPQSFTRRKNDEYVCRGITLGIMGTLIPALSQAPSIDSMLALTLLSHSLLPSNKAVDVVEELGDDVVRSSIYFCFEVVQFFILSYTGVRMSVGIGWHQTHQDKCRKWQRTSDLPLLCKSVT
jgi:hypothetical protein